MKKDVEHKEKKKTDVEGDLTTAQGDLKDVQHELDAALSYYEKLKQSERYFLPGIGEVGLGYGMVRKVRFSSRFLEDFGTSCLRPPKIRINSGNVHISANLCLLLL